MPPRPQLNRIRAVLTDDPSSFARLARALPKRYGGLDDESMLKRMPRGYADDHPAAQWLRYQSFTSGRRLTDAQVTSARLPALLERDFEALLPLVRWINRSVGYQPAARR